MDKTKYQKAFTLFELMIVVVITMILYGFAISSFNNKQNNKDKDKKENALVVLKNIKNYLQTYTYNNKLSLKCTKEKGCFLYLDGTLSDSGIKIDDLDIDNIEVYDYKDWTKRVEFERIEPKKLTMYDVFLEFDLDRDKKMKDMIVVNNQKVYIYNSLHEFPIVLDETYQIDEYFTNIKLEAEENAF